MWIPQLQLRPNLCPLLLYPKSVLEFSLEHSTTFLDNSAHHVLPVEEEHRMMALHYNFPLDS